MSPYIKKAAILLAVAFMAGGFVQKAYGVPTYETHVVGGYTFLQPWLAVDPGQTWQQMAAAKPAGYDVASLAIVDAAMAAASITASDYSTFVSMIGGTGSGVNPDGCPTSKLYCDVFLADPYPNFVGAHRVLLDLNDGSYAGSAGDQDSINQSTTSSAFAGMLYVQTPEPSLSLLLGGSLMGLGYLAHRRQRG